MKKDFIIDYTGYILIKILGSLIRILPLRFNLFLGRSLGELFYYFDTRRRTIAYSNIKIAFAGKLSPSKISNLTKEFYRAFGQNLTEILLIPLINKEYINKYISIEGLNYIFEGFKRGKGVILLGVHEGSWELSNIICVKLGFPLNLLIRDQKHPQLNSLLNFYRSQKGCKIIQRKNQTGQLIQALKNNEAIGLTLDQGGKKGVLVKFFGKDASMASGAVRLVLKYDAVLFPCFYTRINGPYVKIFVDKPFQIKKTGNLEEDIRNNLQEIVRIFERYILKYPKEYLWSYKIWKYSKERNVLILTDRKTGHLRQAQALAKILSNYLKDKDMTAYIDTAEVKFKNKFARYAITFCGCLANKFYCQGCLFCLRNFLEKDIYRSLINMKPDIIISCGSSIAPINYILSNENLAKSIVIMRPPILSTKRFNLVVMPCHDNPPKRKNIVVTSGALNLIDEDYLNLQVERLKPQIKIDKELILGLLIGGDTKDFHLNKSLIKEIIDQMKLSLEKLDAEVLVTTSRRTSNEIEDLVKKEFKDYSRCKLLVIANEKNIPYALGGILGLSQIVIISPESISMISEAANSKKYVLVFNASGLKTRHRRFLWSFSKNKYIYLVEHFILSKTIEDIWLKKPLINTLRDNIIVKEALNKIL